MCQRCVREEFPDRESFCADQGSYMVNFSKCGSCGSMDVKISNRSCVDSGHEEVVTYQHICGSCDHLIAEHEHTFRVEEEFQMYGMSCLLCGSGDDQRSIMPVDSRGPAM